MKLRELLENAPIAVLSGVLIAGFASGIGTYRAVEGILVHGASIDPALPLPLPLPHPPELAAKHSFNKTMDAELKKAWDELEDGRIAYAPRRRMRQGKSEEVRVRLTPSATGSFTEGLVGPLWVERLKTSGSMEAHLDANSDDFEIRQVSSARQALVGKQTDWVWMVLPLKSGPQKTLRLRVTARVYLSNGKEEIKDVVVKSSTITVDVDRWWAAKRFAFLNWQYLLASPILLGIIGWAVKQASRRKKKPAGF